MIPKVNTFTLYLCCGTCYHKSIRFRSYFEARFALFSSSIPSSVLNPEFPKVISNVPGGGSRRSGPPIRPNTLFETEIRTSRVSLPPQGFRPESVIPSRHSGNSRVY